MILVVVYVGAVAVLFLFVVMLLDVDFARFKEGFVQYLPQGALIALIVAAQLIYVMSGWHASPKIAAAATPAGTLSNTAAPRRGALHPLLLLLPGRRVDPPHRDDRRDRPDAAA